MSSGVAQESRRKSLLRWHPKGSQRCRFGAR
jgi:hypothetical protein